jgi:translation initiation factor IF-2
VSAKSGEGIDTLLDILLLQAEIMELKANPDRDAKAVVIESSVQKGRGPVATVICQNGTLRVGNNVVAGVAYGKVRALLDDTGKNLEAIHPGEPGVIVGLSETPEAGETLIKVENDRVARDYAFKRAEYIRQKELSKSTKVTIDELSSMIAEGEIKKLPIILKADVTGSLEALKASLDKAGNDETKVQIIHSGIGGINESDVTLANASENCVILGFNVRPTGSAKTKAKRDGIDIKTYSVIYDLIDDVNAILSGMLSPIIQEESIGTAEVRDIFVVPKIGTIAGCLVTDGTINRGHSARVIRDGIVIYDSKISSLKRFKDDAKEVAKGYECGIGIENFNDLKSGDNIETYQNKEVAATL